MFFGVGDSQFEYGGGLERGCQSRETISSGRFLGRRGEDGGYLFDLGGSFGVGEAVKGGAESGNDVGCLREESKVISAGEGQGGLVNGDMYFETVYFEVGHDGGNERDGHTKLAED